MPSSTSNQGDQDKRRPMGIPYLLGAILGPVAAGALAQGQLDSGDMEKRLGEIQGDIKDLEDRKIKVLVADDVPEHQAALGKSYRRAIRSMGYTEVAEAAQKAEKDGFKEIVVVNPDSQLAAFFHERGHALGGVAKRVLRPMYHVGRVVGGLTIPLAAIAATSSGVTRRDITDDKRRELISSGQRLAALGAVPWAPVLAEEGRASAGALHEMGKRFGPEDVAKARKVLGAAFGTYASALAPSLAALAYLQHYKHNIGKAGRDEKPSMKKAASSVAEPRQEDPIGRDVARITGAAAGGGAAQHFIPTTVKPFKRGAAVAGAVGAAGLVGDVLHRTVLEKKSTAWTPARVHRLADTLGVPWDNNKHFMSFSKEVTGKAHLDDMTEDELAVLAGALARTCHQAEAS